MNEIIYHNGQIITMNNREIADCMIVKDDIIKYIGKYADIPACSNIKVNLDKMVVLPAFIDSHSHFTQMAASFMQLSLDGIKTNDELFIKIKIFIDDNSVKTGEWILAGGFDGSIYADSSSVYKIINAFSDNPILIANKSGHSGYINQSGMSLLGINENTRSPMGGKIEMTNGIPAGYLEENAFFKYQKLIPMPDKNAFIKAYKKAQEEYLSNGITTIQEGLLTKEMLPIYKILKESRLLKADIVAYADIEAFEMLMTENEMALNNYKNKIRIGGIKIFLDGSPQSKTAWMKAPYLDSSSCGYGTMTDDEVMYAIKTAIKYNTQIIAHCNGDAACEQFICCVEKAYCNNPHNSSLRPVIIHSQLIDENQIKRAKRLGIILSFFVSHIYHWGDTHIKSFGPDRASKISPVNTALKNDVLYTFHQDSPVVPPNMLECVKSAVERRTKSGILLGENERIDIYNALKGITINSAIQYGEENRKGSLCVGKNADFVILDKNPFDTKVKDLDKINVLKTFKDGMEIYTK